MRKKMNQEETYRGNNNYRFTFTVFTPTYNRAYTLHRVYESLAAQTDRDFEWLIVDDGSTDHTRELVNQWKQIATFPIRYFYQTNRGKHTAYNFAAREALGEFLICLDSDDACIPTALERFRYHWNTIPPQQRSRFSGIDCHCQDTDGNLIGTLFPRSPLDSNVGEMRYRYKVKGEKWGMQRTDIMRQFLFPEHTNHKMPFVPETVVWSRMTQHYPARYVNECLRIFYANHGSDQVTKMRFTRNPLGAHLWAKSILEIEIDYFWYNPFPFLKAAANYSRSSLYLKKRFWRQYVDLKSNLGRLLWVLMLPLGVLLWVRDCLQK